MLLSFASNLTIRAFNVRALFRAVIVFGVRESPEKKRHPTNSYSQQRFVKFLRHLHLYVSMELALFALRPSAYPLVGHCVRPCGRLFTLVYRGNGPNQINATKFSERTPAQSFTGRRHYSTFKSSAHKTTRKCQSHNFSIA